MKKKALLILAILTIIIAFAGCEGSATKETYFDNQGGVEAEAESDVEKAGHDAIYKFIENYNKGNPDAVIKDCDFNEENGEGHIAVVTCDVGTIGLFAWYTDDPYIQAQEVNEDESLDHYRDVFYRFSKGYDPDITNETLDGYWDKALESSNEGIEFEEFVCNIMTDSSGQPYHMEMGGYVK